MRVIIKIIFFVSKRVASPVFPCEFTRATARARPRRAEEAKKEKRSMFSLRDFNSRRFPFYLQRIKETELILKQREK